MKTHLYTAFFTIAFFCSSLHSSAQKPTTALALNDYLVSITDSLYNAGQTWGEKFTAVYQTKEFALLQPLRVSMEKLIERKQLEVITLKDIGGSEKLRLAMLDLLFFEARMVREGFLPIEKLNKQSSQDEINKAIELLTTVADTENEYLQKVRKAQDAYAAKNGFTIEDDSF